ncbi:MAG TPA: WD40 repeat domain-containing protein [Pirellulales bacterium]|nr:WD40 repeat domain-containing protein [Pirellulales bacterium]
MRHALSGHAALGTASHVRRSVLALGWHDQGATVLTADSLAVRFWDAATGKLKRSTREHISTNLQWQLVPRFSDDGRFLLIPGAGVRVIDTASGDLLATMRPLPDRQAAVISPDGHYLGTPWAEEDLVYVVQTADGQELLSPKEFAAKYGWKNDPSKVKLP